MRRRRCRQSACRHLCKVGASGKNYVDTSLEPSEERRWNRFCGHIPGRGDVEVGCIPGRRTKRLVPHSMNASLSIRADGAASSLRSSRAGQSFPIVLSALKEASWLLLQLSPRIRGKGGYASGDRRHLEENQGTKQTIPSGPSPTPSSLLRDGRESAAAADKRSWQEHVLFHGGQGAIKEADISFAAVVNPARQWVGKKLHG